MWPGNNTGPFHRAPCHPINCVPRALEYSCAVLSGFHNYRSIQQRQRISLLPYSSRPLHSPGQQNTPYLLPYSFKLLHSPGQFSVLHSSYSSSLLHSPSLPPSPFLMSTPSFFHFNPPQPTPSYSYVPSSTPPATPLPSLTPSSIFYSSEYSPILYLSSIFLYSFMFTYLPIFIRHPSPFPPIPSSYPLPSYIPSFTPLQFLPPHLTSYASLLKNSLSLLSPS